MLGETLDDWPWPHLLLWHMLDVAAVAAEWLQGSRALRRLLARQARCSEQVACAYVLFFIALHDIGKCEAGMQATAPEAVRYLLGDKEVVRARLTAQPSCGHGSAGLYLMEDDGFAFLTDPNAYAWLSAVCAHHGQLKLYPEGFSEQQSMRPAAQRERELDRAARAELVQVLAALFLEPAGLSLERPFPECPPDLAGFCSTGDWLGSNRAYFPYSADALVPIKSYLTASRKTARRVLADAKLLPAPQRRKNFKELFSFEARGVQALVDNFDVKGPQLILVEAETGCGKTEAAMALASRIVAQGDCEGVVFAMPTQATANSMFERVLKDYATPGFEGASASLAHGSAASSELLRALVELDVQGAEGGAATCSEFLAGSSKTKFLAAVDVCTIDQVLSSVLRLRYATMKRFGLAKTVLVVDEVHAYDDYSLCLLKEVLRRQRAAGASVVLLSATLPSRIKEELARAWMPQDGLGQAVTMSDHYPLITQLDAAGVVHESTEAKSDGRGRTIFVEPKRTAKCDPAWLVPRIVDAVKAGAMVAVICNTVKAAQQLAFQLEGRLPEKVDLFHSRFTLLDRKVHETAGFTDPRVTVLLEEEEGRYGDVAVVYENWLPLWHTEQLLLEVARTHAGKLDSSKGNGREAENIRCWVERAYGGIDASVPEHVRTRHADWDKERKAWCETAERNISRKLGCNERKR